MIEPEPSPHSESLKSLTLKLQVVKDLTTAVGKGFKNGLFLYGQGRSGEVIHGHESA